jgi:proteasome lid subunit RPN8/RPN11
MIRIEGDAWAAMVRHAESCYPNECCGILLGTANGDRRVAARAIACRNAYEGSQKDRFQIDPRDQFEAERRARELGLAVLGFFHSHPDEDSYFSKTDFRNSWPWYSNVVLSVRQGSVRKARSFVVYRKSERALKS